MSKFIKPTREEWALAVSNNETNESYSRYCYEKFCAHRKAALAAQPMLRFIVRRHRDANATYETIVEARTPGDAQIIASSRDYTGFWRRSVGISEHDSCDYDTGADDEVPMNTPLIEADDTSHEDFYDKLREFVGMISRFTTFRESELEIVGQEPDQYPGKSAIEMVENAQITLNYLESNHEATESLIFQARNILGLPVDPHSLHAGEIPDFGKKEAK